LLQKPYYLPVLEFCFLLEPRVEDFFARSVCNTVGLRKVWSFDSIYCPHDNRGSFFCTLAHILFMKARVRVSVQWRVFCLGKCIRHEHFDWHSLWPKKSLMEITEVGFEFPWNLIELMLCAWSKFPGSWTIGRHSQPACFCCAHYCSCLHTISLLLDRTSGCWTIECKWCWCMAINSEWMWKRM